jgi:hypothetical protein
MTGQRVNGSVVSTGCVENSQSATSTPRTALQRQHVFRIWPHKPVLTLSQLEDVLLAVNDLQRAVTHQARNVASVEEAISICATAAAAASAAAAAAAAGT